MKKATVTNFEEGYPVLRNFKSETAPANSTVSRPILEWALALGSAVVRIDVVSVSNKEANDVPVFTDNTIGSLPGFPNYWNPRTPLGPDDINRVTFTGRIVKKEGDPSIRVPAGTYKLVYRALKMTGRKNTGRDYERWESPNFIWA